jgi:GTPase SAR1 family protein
MVWRYICNGVSFVHVMVLTLHCPYFRRETFNRTAIWLEEVREQARADVTFLLIGNKCDLSN